MSQSHTKRCCQLAFTSLLAILITACSGTTDSSRSGILPLEITQDTACTLDGMLLADYAGPKAQIHYQNVSTPDFFCDTIEMFNIYLNPEQIRNVSGVFVQDMGKTHWSNPESAWIDAKTAWYVVGSNKRGSMGPTFASFAQEIDAKNFAEAFGGDVLPFAEVTPDMASLDGGALHDHSM